MQPNSFLLPSLLLQEQEEARICTHARRQKSTLMIASNANLFILPSPTNRNWKKLGSALMLGDKRALASNANLFILPSPTNRNWKKRASALMLGDKRVLASNAN